MDAWLDQVHWGYRSGIYLFTGLLIAIPLCWMPFCILKHTCQWPGLSANAITMWRVPLTWIGWILMFVYDYHFLGYVIVVTGLSLDRTDGRTAVQMRKMPCARVKHNEKLGEVIDPAADKLTFLPPFPYFAFLGIFPWWLVGVLFAFEIVSTLIRSPFNLGKKFFKNGEHTERVNAKKKGRSRNAATGVGKSKVAFQFTSLLVAAPLAFGWTDYSTMIPGVLCALAVIVGAGSIVSRLDISRKVDETVAPVTHFFDHE